MESSQVDQGFLPLIADKFGEIIVDASWSGSEARVTVLPDRLMEVLLFVRDDPAISLLYPADLSAFDTVGNIVLFYRLVSLEKKHSLVLRVLLPREDPHVPTATAIWLGVNWHEREVFDLFGVQFDGHPDLRRILLPDEWVGYPFRKDYVSVPSGDPHFGPQPIDLPEDWA